jgi:hypothetical protein
MKDCHHVNYFIKLNVYFQLIFKNYAYLYFFFDTKHWIVYFTLLALEIFFYVNGNFYGNCCNLWFVVHHVTYANIIGNNVL